MIYNICFIFILFFCYSVSGWIIECTYCSYKQKKFVHDRGFLIGPYCPIYGWGGIAIYLLLSKYQNDPITLFILAAVGASVLEYLTSYFMEKMFKARWWDYSDKKFNIEGRICLGNAALFGLLGMLFVYYVNPFAIDLLKSIPNNILIIISIILMVIYLIDNILSFIIVSKLKSSFAKVNKDSTSDIDKEIKEILNSYNFFVKRLFNAFPNFNGEIIPKKLQEIASDIDKVRIKNRKHKKTN